MWRNVSLCCWSELPLNFFSLIHTHTHTHSYIFFFHLGWFYHKKFWFLIGSYLLSFFNRLLGFLLCLKDLPQSGKCEKLPCGFSQYFVPLNLTVWFILFWGPTKYFHKRPPICWDTFYWPVHFVPLSVSHCVRRSRLRVLTFGSVSAPSGLYTGLRSVHGSVCVRVTSTLLQLL